MNHGVASQINTDDFQSFNPGFKLKNQLLLSVCFGEAETCVHLWLQNYPWLHQFLISWSTTNFPRFGVRGLLPSGRIRSYS